MNWNVVIAVLTLLALSTMAAFLVGLGLVYMTLGLWSSRWPRVPGVIESSALRHGHNGDGLSMYWVETRYSYFWKVPRHGSRIEFASLGASSNPRFKRASAESLHRVLPPGAPIHVYVCPRYPSIAVLRPGLNLASLGFVAVGLIFAFVPLWFAWLRWVE